VNSITNHIKKSQASAWLFYVIRVLFLGHRIKFTSKYKLVFSSRGKCRVRQNINKFEQ